MERIMIVDSDLIQIKVLRDAFADEFLILGCNRGTNAMDLFKVFQPSALTPQKIFGLRRQPQRSI